MKTIELNLPRSLVFGTNCFDGFIERFSQLKFKKTLLIADVPVLEKLSGLIAELAACGNEYTVFSDIHSEPTIVLFNSVLKLSRERQIDSVIGIGGGSVLDVAKLIAVLTNAKVSVEDVIGIGKIKNRSIFLSCLPTTAGTGSEVSPNSILLDETDGMKKGIVSPYLVPDMTYSDPQFTLSVPAHITAATGIDALTHCIEAFANKNAHPVIDQFALQGIKLIYHNLPEAFRDGTNIDAREKVALGSLYGGICLGPVNTAAVHALAYPLGGKYHIAHGLSNAMLLSAIMRYNLETGVEKYAVIARSIGAKEGNSDSITAVNGIKLIEQLCKNIKIPTKLSLFNVPERDVPEIARTALTVQRLLKNNLREMNLADAEKIYYSLY